jgi:hypothetical protein
MGSSSGALRSASNDRPIESSSRQAWFYALRAPYWKFSRSRMAGALARRPDDKGARRGLLPFPGSLRGGGSSHADVSRVGSTAIGAASPLPERLVSGSSSSSWGVTLTKGKAGFITSVPSTCGFELRAISATATPGTVGLSCGEGPNARGTGGIPKAGSAAVSFAASGSATTWGETTGSTGAVRIVVGRYLPEGDSGTDSRGR